MIVGNPSGTSNRRASVAAPDAAFERGLHLAQQAAEVHRRGVQFEAAGPPARGRGHLRQPAREPFGTAVRRVEPRPRRRRHIRLRHQGQGVRKDVQRRAQLVRGDRQQPPFLIGFAPGSLARLLELADEAAAFRLNVVPLQAAAHHEPQLVRLPRLREVIVHATGVDRLHQRVDVGVAGEQHADGFGVLDCGACQQLGAGHLGHALIDDHQRDRLACQCRQSLGRRRSGGHSVAVAEGARNRPQTCRFIVDHQNGVRRHDRSRKAQRYTHKSEREASDWGLG